MESTGAVSTVIVAYSSGDLLPRCLATVGSEHGEVVVVDNASPDQGARLACREFPHVRLIERPHNDGFGTAANAGIASTEGRWILVLNPDAWPMDDAIARLAEFAHSRPRLGAAGPLLFDAKGRPQRSTIRPPLSPAALAAWAAFPRALSGAYGVLRTRAKVLRDNATGSEFLQGAAMLLRREAFDQVGGFDESFFMYGEDADLCARLRDAGWGVELSPVARFVHVGAGSTHAVADRMYVELLRSWLRLIAKRRGPEEAERARRWLLLALRARALWAREPQLRMAAAWLASGRVGDLLTTAK